MAKKQNPHVLSPPNYIRQRARNLPIFRTFINENWKEVGVAEIIVARKHRNENLTFGLFLVDLKCLGVKNTFYVFNEPESELNDLIQNDLDESLEFIEVDYNLAHNIIHAAWEFADELGFSPHPDFLAVTQYLLDEDTDAIPILEIPCGDKDGKPLYVRGAEESNSRAKQIINQLEKAVGVGNFDVVLSASEAGSEG